MPRVSKPDRLLRDRTDGSPIIPPLQNLPAANDTMRSVLGSYSSLSDWVYQEVGPRLSEKPGSQFRTEIDTKVEKAMRQQVNALLPALLELKIQASLDAAPTD